MSIRGLERGALSLLPMVVLLAAVAAFGLPEGAQAHKVCTVEEIESDPDVDQIPADEGTLNHTHTTDQYAGFRHYVDGDPGYPPSGPEPTTFDWKAQTFTKDPTKGIDYGTGTCENGALVDQYDAPAAPSGDPNITAPD